MSLLLLHIIDREWMNEWMVVLLLISRLYAPICLLFFFFFFVSVLFFIFFLWKNACTSLSIDRHSVLPTNLLPFIRLNFSRFLTPVSQPPLDGTLHFLFYSKTSGAAATIAAMHPSYGGYVQQYISNNNINRGYSVVTVFICNRSMYVCIWVCECVCVGVMPQNVATCNAFLWMLDFCFYYLSCDFFMWPPTMR